MLLYANPFRSFFSFVVGLRMPANVSDPQKLGFDHHAEYELPPSDRPRVDPETGKQITAPR